MADQRNFAETLFRLLDRLEVIFLIGATASVLALNAGIDAGTSGIMIALSGLAGVYFLNAYKPPVQGDAGEKKDFPALFSQTILPKVMWISCAVGAVGLLFHLLRLEGAPQMLMISTASNAIGVIIFLGLSAISPQATQKLSTVLYRSVPILLITGYFLYGITD